MREWLVYFSERATILIDFVALVVILFGTAEVCVAVARLMLSKERTGPVLRDVWLRYARWLVAGLTFQLAADIIETSISTSWETIARVGAIAVIRTFLNYFLDRDLAEVRERQHPPAVEPVP